MAASTKKKTLTTTTEAPRGFEVDIVVILQAVVHELSKIGRTGFLSTSDVV